MPGVYNFGRKALGGEARSKAASERLGSAGLRGEEDLCGSVKVRVGAFERSDEKPPSAAEAPGFPEAEGGGEGEKGYKGESSAADGGSGDGGHFLYC